MAPGGSAGNDGQSTGGGGGGGYKGGGGGGGGGNCVPDDACLLSYSVNNKLAAARSRGRRRRGAGADYHSSIVTNFTQAIDAPGPSGTITYTVNATPTPTPTTQVQGIVTPSTGAAGPTLAAGIGLLATGALLTALVAPGRRRRSPDVPWPAIHPSSRCRVRRSLFG